MFQHVSSARSACHRQSPVLRGLDVLDLALDEDARGRPLGSCEVLFASLEHARTAVARGTNVELAGTWPVARGIEAN